MGCLVLLAYMWICACTYFISTHLFCFRFLCFVNRRFFSIPSLVLFCLISCHAILCTLAFSQLFFCPPSLLENLLFGRLRVPISRNVVPLNIYQRNVLREKRTIKFILWIRLYFRLSLARTRLSSKKKSSPALSAQQLLKGTHSRVALCAMWCVAVTISLCVLHQNQRDYCVLHCIERTHGLLFYR